MNIPLTPFRTANHLTEHEDRVALLSDAAATGDGAALADALGKVGRAYGMTKLSEATGIKRQQLYKSLSRDGNPTLSTVTKVLAALGMRLSVERKP
ncbi:addiction module antidote protein [Sphingobium chungbukense]|uniref:Addiction module antitoxin n=1 Tax=Sphingobium chungbukense TaxID=56193 RepID=A0A0M3ASW2_9SPHN|nr:addiction module antidote protein [Sphingobium chungbukense]KKW92978.1 addiction module antitoxin [Sphingobium chungbukense]